MSTFFLNLDLERCFPLPSPTDGPLGSLLARAKPAPPSYASSAPVVPGGPLAEHKKATDAQARPGQVKPQVAIAPDFNEAEWVAQANACFLTNDSGEANGLLFKICRITGALDIARELKAKMNPRFMPENQTLVQKTAYETDFEAGIDNFFGSLYEWLARVDQFVSNRTVVIQECSGREAFADAMAVCTRVFERFRETKSAGEVEGFIVAARFSRENLPGFPMRKVLHHSSARNSGAMARWLETLDDLRVNQLMVLACAQAIGNYVYDSLRGTFQPENLMMINGWQHAVANYSCAVRWYSRAPPSTRSVQQLNTSVAQAYKRTTGNSESRRQNVVLDALS